MSKGASAFTKGPWHAETYRFEPPHYGVFAGNHCVAKRVLSADDARLIAAAPELYRSNERQRDLIASVQALCSQYLEPGGLTEDEFISRVIAQLDGPVQREIEEERDTALAKARGQQ